MADVLKVLEVIEDKGREERKRMKSCFPQFCAHAELLAIENKRSFGFEDKFCICCEGAMLTNELF